MEFRILGPLEVRADDRAVEIGGAKPRALLAVLLLHADEPMTAERLALALWGEEAPVGAVKTVQVHVSRLRKALGETVLPMSAPAGYRLRMQPDALDVDRFEQHVAAGRAALAAARPDAAAGLLREALALWRGDPLAEFAWAPFASVERNRLDELHIAAQELRVEADLAGGRHAELIAELQQLVDRHPWSERLHAHLMLALYRSGRQADALAAFRHAREVLVEELAIEPGPELQDLHRALLVHDPSLDAPPAAGRSAPDRRAMLPTPPNRTIGRARDVEAVRARLRSGSVRLLTLTGPGGVGKTRLALEIARAVGADFADGAHFVSLAAVQRPQDVPAVIVTSLGIVVLAGESVEHAVARFLAAKQLLLVVDNCEHLPAAAPFIGGLSTACPRVTVLATSREPLNVQAEQRHPVAPLALPDAAAPEGPLALADVAAVALFRDRARAHDPQFEVDHANAAAVVDICRRVDGLPLAIELAAARCGLLAPDELAERLHAALGAPGAAARDAPARQQTLSATIDWSHDLLDDDEKACFARFAVFAGGATVEAAEAVTGARFDVLDRLVAKSLLVRRGHARGQTRLGMLETVRAYAAERFAASADHDSVRARHHRHFLAHARRHGTERALWGTGRDEHVACCDAEIDNLHAALDWALAQERANPALELCTLLGWYWLARERYADAVDRIDRALDKPDATADPTLRVRTMCMKGWALWQLGRGDEHTPLVAEAVTIARNAGDAVVLSRALENRAIVEAWVGRLDVAAAFADEAIAYAGAAGDRWALAMATRARAMAASDGDELRERVERAAALMEEVGNIYHVTDVFVAAALAALRNGSDHDARAFVDRAIPLARRLSSAFMLMFLHGKLGVAALLTGDVDTAREAFRQELERCRELVVLPLAYEGLAGLAGVAAVREDLDRAGRLAGAAAAHRHEDAHGLILGRLHATVLEPARRRRGAEAWDAAVREGAALDLEAAIAYALEERPADVPDHAAKGSAGAAGAPF